jgi:hypothetical protein
MYKSVATTAEVREYLSTASAVGLDIETSPFEAYRDEPIRSSKSSDCGNCRSYSRMEKTPDGEEFLTYARPIYQQFELFNQKYGAHIVFFYKNR